MLTIDELKARGACRNVEDKDIFFPPFDSPSSTAVAIAICALCTVQPDCLAWALKHDENGVWGGTSEATRRSLKRPRARTHCIGCQSPNVVHNGAERSEVCVDCGLSWSL